MNIFRSISWGFILILLFCISSCGTDTNKEQDNIQDSNSWNYAPEKSLHFEEGYSILNRSGKKVFIDTKGNIPEALMQENIEKKVGAEVSSLDHFHDGFAVGLFKRNDGKLSWGYINKKGENPYDKSFEYAGEFDDRRAIVKKDGKWGMIDTYGKFIVPPKYDGISPMRDNNIWIKEGAQWKYVSHPKMEQILEGKYQIYGEVFEGTFWIDKKAANPDIVKRAYANTKGEIISPWFDNATDFSEGLSAFEQNGKWGYINKDGDIIIEPQFEYSSQFSEGLAAFTTITKEGFGDWGYIDKTGNVAIPTQFKFASNFKNGFAEVKNQNGYISFINTSGKLIQDYKFDLSYHFHEGLAAVKVENKWGFIDTKGMMIISPKYDKISTFVDNPFDGGFSGGVAKVEIDGHEFFIDKRGNCVMGCLE